MADRKAFKMFFATVPPILKRWNGALVLRNLHLGKKSLRALIKAGSLRKETFRFHLPGPRAMGSGQAVLDTVHVTNFVQSHHCRWRTDSFTFVRVVSSIFFDFRRLSSDLR